MENPQTPVSETNTVNPMGSTTSPTLPEASSQTVTPNQGGNKLLVGILSLVAFVALGVGGVFAYMKYFPSPEMVMSKMVEKSGDMKTLEASGKVTMQIDVKDIPPTVGKTNSTSSIDFNGKFDVNDVNNPNADFSLNFSSDVSDVNGQGNVSFGADYKMIGKMLYFNLSQLTLPKMPQLAGLDTSFFVNKWIKFDIEEMEKGQEKSKELTKEQTRKIDELFKDETTKEAKMFKVVETLPSETIDGMATYHYRFPMDKEELRRIAKGVTEIMDNKPLSGDELVSFNKFFDMIEVSPVEIWIGKEDFYVRKFSGSVTFDSTKSYKEEGDPKASGKIDMTFMYKNINKPVVIEAPKDAQTIEELMSSVFGGEERVNRAPENFFMGEPVRVESTESAMLKEATESADLKMTGTEINDNIPTTPDGE